ncbi:hypothetical protein ACFFK0_16275 [Paenibacillus chartarius]|uniref:Uncharacterized protein n=1 Tax=Paenibacillus chartarius TaxID=747481 RepID=A0ABV6DMW5_9BACL
MQNDVGGLGKGMSAVVDDIRAFGAEIHEHDEVLLARYSFALEDRLLTVSEAKSFLSFLRAQLSSQYMYCRNPMTQVL